jgi:hypothetical protein
MANFILLAELTLQSAPHWDGPMEDQSYLPVLLAELLGFIDFTSFLLSCPHSSAGLHGTCFSLYSLASISYIFEHLLWSCFWIYYSIQRCARFEHKSGSCVAYDLHQSAELYWNTPRPVLRPSQPASTY